MVWRGVGDGAQPGSVVLAAPGAAPVPLMAGVAANVFYPQIIVTQMPGKRERALLCRAHLSQAGLRAGAPSIPSGIRPWTQPGEL